MSFNLSFTTDQLRSNSVIVQIYFSTMQSVTLTSDPAYTFMSLLSDIGGALGLMLGSTLLTIVEIAQFALSLGVEVIRMRQEKSKIKQKEKIGIESLSKTTIIVVDVADTIGSDDVSLY